VKLKAHLKDLKDLDAAFHDLYEKTDDGYVLAVEDKDYKTHLEEFRSNNRELKKKQADYEAQLKKFEGIDPEKYQKAITAYDKLEQSEEARLIADGKLDEVLSKRTEAMKRDFDAQVSAKTKALQEVTAERDLYKTKYSSHTIDRQVQDTISKIGELQPGGLAFVLERARGTWQLDEKGEVVPRKDGQVMFGKSGEPLKMEEWANGILQEAPYLFRPSTGGGATGGRRGDGESARVVDGRDPVAMGKYAKEIAEGKMVVR